MSEQNVREWVEEKLEAGVTEERLKKVMRNTGKDPSIVDEVTGSKENPFHDSEIRPKPDENVFEQEEAPEDDEGKDTERSFSYSQRDNDRDDGSSEENSLKERLSAVSGSPDVSLPKPSMPDADGKVLVSVCLVLLFSGILFGHFTGTLYDVENSARSAAGMHDGCPDVGVLIESISASEGATTADVNVARGEARVVLEVFEGGEKLGETRKTVEGGRKMTVDAIGDRAVFRPVDCERYRSEKRY